MTLAGTLALPAGKGPFPAALLITGSGPQERDETVFGKKPFAVLARVFASKGIASLRYDDRGIAASTGDFASATSADFARDAETALRFLKADARIRPDGIGYAGHSEGGLVALIAAVAPALPEKAKPAFVASISGPMDRGIDILLGQSAAILDPAEIPTSSLVRQGMAAPDRLERRRTDPGRDPSFQPLSTISSSSP